MISATDLKLWFRDTIPRDDEIVLVYSGIWTFGHRLKETPTIIPEIIVECLEEVLGTDSTLVFPAYTYSYNRTRRYDILGTPPETGVLPSFFLNRKGTRRTWSAINSFVAKGPLADEMAPILGKTIWGSGSLLEWMEKKNTRIVTLGLPWSLSCGYLHRIEELGEVPYRYFKSFPGKYRDEQGQWKHWTETQYVRPLDVQSTFDWSRVDQMMNGRGQILKASQSGIHLESCLARDMIKTGLDVIAEDPYAVVRNAGEIRQWVEGGGKQREIEEMERRT